MYVILIGIDGENRRKKRREQKWAVLNWFMYFMIWIWSVLLMLIFIDTVMPIFFLNVNQRNTQTRSFHSQNISSDGHIFDTHNHMRIKRSEKISFPVKVFIVIMTTWWQENVRSKTGNRFLLESLPLSMLPNAIRANDFAGRLMKSK